MTNYALDWLPLAEEIMTFPGARKLYPELNRTPVN
jgi:hypothetical protein